MKEHEGIRTERLLFSLSGKNNIMIGPSINDLAVLGGRGSRIL